MNTIKYWIMKRQMKRNEVKVKAMFYGTIASIMDNQEEITNALELVKKLYIELKDVPIDELRREFISKIAELAHEQAVKEREAEKSA